MSGTAIYGDDDGANGEAEGSAYRYVLTRRIEATAEHPLTPLELARSVLFIGLNPSTATAYVDDPTIRREVNYARAWGYGTLVKCNLFAYRATDPKVMMAALAPVGSWNDAFLRQSAASAARIVICWGVGGAFRNRGVEVRKMLANFELHHFGKTKNGEPKHPLYLKADLMPTRWA